MLDSNHDGDEKDKSRYSYNEPLRSDGIMLVPGWETASSVTEVFHEPDQARFQSVGQIRQRVCLNYSKAGSLYRFDYHFSFSLELIRQLMASLH